MNILVLEYDQDFHRWINKQGKFLPCGHIPVVSKEYIRKTKPDFVLILPWNIKDEIIEQLNYIREWKGKFVIPILRLEVI